MKAQVATEFLVIVSFALIILIPIIYYSFFYSYESTAASETQRAARTIADAADYVYSLGNGTTTNVRISIPAGVVGGLVLDHTINYKISTSAGVSDVIAITRAEIAGVIPNKTGVYNVNIQNSNGLVVISW